MPTLYHADYAPGKTVAVTMQQVNGSTGAPLDLWWKESGTGSGAWVAGASATAAERRISLSDANTYGIYTGGKSAALGSYTGYVMVYYWDVALATPIDSEKIYLKVGHQVEPEKATSDIIDGGATASISPWHIRPERTWTVERDASACRNVVYMSGAAVVTLAMDFGRVMNEGTGLASITSVAILGATVGTPAISQDGKQAHFLVSGLTPATTYTCYVVAVTLDGDTLVGVGTLKTEATSPD